MCEAKLSAFIPIPLTDGSHSVTFQQSENFLTHLKSGITGRKILADFFNSKNQLVLLIAFRLPKNIKGSVHIQQAVLA